MRPRTPKTVTAYIAAAPKEARGMLRRLRAIVKALAPKADESISYGLAAYKLDGRPIAYFGAFARHVGFFPGSSAVLGSFKKELAGRVTGKGSVRFPFDEPLPVALVRKLVRFKIALVRARDGAAYAKRKRRS